MPVVQNIPSFLLRGIDYQKILIKYKEGKYSNLKLEIKKPSPIPTSPVNRNDNSPVDKNFSFKDKNGNIRTFVFANHTPAKRCEYCLKELTKESAPLPIKRSTKNDMIGLVDKFCDLNCAYAGIKNCTNVPYEYRDNFYEESEMLLKQLFLEQYPNADISEFQPAPDRSLLKEFGGELDYTDWKSRNYRFLKNNSTSVIPIKSYYEKVQCSS